MMIWQLAASAAFVVLVHIIFLQKNKKLWGESKVIASFCFLALGLLVGFVIALLSGDDATKALF